MRPRLRRTQRAPDPAGEFLTSLDTVDALDIDLVLAGHGRPVRDAPGLIEGNRREVANGIDRIRRALEGNDLTAYEIVPKLLGVDELSPMQINWGLSITLSYLHGAAGRGRVLRRRWLRALEPGGRRLDGC